MRMREREGERNGDMRERERERERKGDRGKRERKIERKKGGKDQQKQRERVKNKVSPILKSHTRLRKLLLSCNNHPVEIQPDKKLYKRLLLNVF